jgi:2-polyprenyl-3-methyl-5-hydroxy-6-metoxy-1,4-benzoquinol methylase
MERDFSNGWEAVAHDLIAFRGDTGLTTVMEWATSLPKGGSIIDIGCGSGEPMSSALVGMGFQVAGIDASPTLAAAYRRRFQGALIACEPAERSTFFGRQFNAAIAIGLLFLLGDNAQRVLIHNVAAALRPQGRFLFSAPKQPCTWQDLLTDRLSTSLGAAEYRRVLAGVGMEIVGEYTDEGDNYYYDAIKAEALGVVGAAIGQ